MPEGAITWIIMLAAVAALGLMVLLQNRAADRQGGRNRATPRIFVGGRNSFRKREENLHTEERKINRHWKP